MYLLTDDIQCHTLTAYADRENIAIITTLHFSLASKLLVTVHFLNLLFNLF